MKLILLLVILLFCSTFAHEEACKTNEDCPKHQFCTNHNHCHNKFQEFCQNSLTCKLQFGKDTYCSLKITENVSELSHLAEVACPTENVPAKNTVPEI
jgi:hypothetical protein